MVSTCNSKGKIDINKMLIFHTMLNNRIRKDNPINTKKSDDTVLAKFNVLKNYFRKKKI